MSYYHLHDCVCMNDLQRTRLHDDCVYDGMYVCMYGFMNACMITQPERPTRVHNASVLQYNTTHAISDVALALHCALSCTRPPNHELLEEELDDDEDEDSDELAFFDCESCVTCIHGLPVFTSASASCKILPSSAESCMGMRVQIMPTWLRFFGLALCKTRRPARAQHLSRTMAASDSASL